MSGNVRIARIGEDPSIEHPAEVVARNGEALVLASKIRRPFQAIGADH